MNPADGPGRDDALQVPAHELRDGLHRLEPGAHDAAAPVPQHLTHDVELLALADLAQRLALSSPWRLTLARVTA